MEIIGQILSLANQQSHYFLAKVYQTVDVTAVYIM